MVARNHRVADLPDVPAPAEIELRTPTPAAMDDLVKQETAANLEVIKLRASSRRARFTSPWGEGGAKRRVRGDGLSIDRNPSPEFLTRSKFDLSRWERYR